MMRGSAGRSVTDFNSFSRSSQSDSIISASGSFDAGGGEHVRVFVRIRPITQQERSQGSKCILEPVNNNGLTIWDPTSFEASSRPELASINPSCWSRNFMFDNCLWSNDRDHPNFSTQDDVYDTVGQPIVNWALDGHNCCIFAYGQTGAGKSFTMMGNMRGGNPEDYGLIPRICFGLFKALAISSDDNISPNDHQNIIELSHLEIYNETVKDLLTPSKNSQLRVREHPQTGVTVSNLTTVRVSCFEEILQLMRIGDKARTVASTNMNVHSSRSHAIVTLTVRQAFRNNTSNNLQHKASRIHLVDLAGSERVANSGAKGTRLRETNNINKSLSVLGDVIKCLGERKSSKKIHIPYRNSLLTMVLKDALGGNSHTVMIAAVSPCSRDYEETIGTLKYADRTKNIRMFVQANIMASEMQSSSAAELVPLLTAEVHRLREMLHAQQIQKDSIAATPCLSSSSLSTSIISIPPQLQQQQDDAALAAALAVKEMQQRVRELESQLEEREQLIMTLVTARKEQEQPSSPDVSRWIAEKNDMNMSLNMNMNSSRKISNSSCNSSSSNMGYSSSSSSSLLQHHSGMLIDRSGDRVRDRDSNRDLNTSVNVYNNNNSSTSNDISSSSNISSNIRASSNINSGTAAAASMMKSSYKNREKEKEKRREYDNDIDNDNDVSFIITSQFVYYTSNDDDNDNDNDNDGIEGHGNGSIEVINIEEGECILGSDISCVDILLEAPDIRPIHCSVICDTYGRVWMRPVQKAIVIINSIPIFREHLLQHGDLVSIGRQIELRFEQSAFEKERSSRHTNLLNISDNNNSVNSIYKSMQINVHSSDNGTSTNTTTSTNTSPSPNEKKNSTNTNTNTNPSSTSTSTSTIHSSPPMKKDIPQLQEAKSHINGIMLQSPILPTKSRMNSISGIGTGNDDNTDTIVGVGSHTKGVLGELRPIHKPPMDINDFVAKTVYSPSSDHWWDQLARVAEDSQDLEAVDLRHMLQAVLVKAEQRPKKQSPSSSSPPSSLPLPLPDDTTDNDYHRLIHNNGNGNGNNNNYNGHSNFHSNHTNGSATKSHRHRKTTTAAATTTTTTTKTSSAHSSPSYDDDGDQSSKSHSPEILHGSRREITGTSTGSYNVGSDSHDTSDQMEFIISSLIADRKQHHSKQLQHQHQPQEHHHRRHDEHRRDTSIGNGIPPPPPPPPLRNGYRGDESEQFLSSTTTTTSHSTSATSSGATSKTKSQTGAVPSAAAIFRQERMRKMGLLGAVDNNNDNRNHTDVEVEDEDVDESMTHRVMSNQFMETSSLSRDTNSHVMNRDSTINTMSSSSSSKTARRPLLSPHDMLLSSSSSSSHRSNGNGNGRTSASSYMQTRPLREWPDENINQSSSGSPTKFEREASALEKELAQMQRALRDRMHRYRELQIGPLQREN